MKKTSWFAIFVAVLVAGTYYFEFYRVDRQEKIKNEEAKIVSFPSDQIHQIEVENKSGKVLLKRDVDGWRLETPFKDWADNQFTEDFINGLAEEKALETAAEGDLIDWAVYGLDRDFSKVIFTNQQGNSLMVLVSDKKNFEGNSFLRRGQENKVLVASSQWALRSQKPPLDFRDKRLFRGKIGSVEAISFQSPKDEFDIVNKDNKWVNEKKPEIKLDQNKVREVLSSLNEVRALEFLEELPTSKLISKLSLRLKDKTWSTEIRQGSDKSYYAAVSDPVFILKLDPGQTDKFRDLTFMELRDRKEAFDFQNLLVRHIEFQNKLKKMTLTKEKDKDKDHWKLEQDPQAKVDASAVRSFISRLSDSAVTEYLEKTEQSRFKDADHKVILKDENQKVIYELTWGPVLKKKGLGGEKTLILAQSNLFKDVFGLDQSVIDSWGLMNLVPLDQNIEKEKIPKEQL